jgi:hypothetical protein
MNNTLNSKTTTSKINDMGISNIHGEEFKLFTMEYNTVDDEPDNDLEHYVKTQHCSNEDYDTGIHDKFINNLDTTFYVMQMQNPEVLTHAQMK